MVLERTDGERNNVALGVGPETEERVHEDGGMRNKENMFSDRQVYEKHKAQNHDEVIAVMCH